MALSYFSLYLLSGILLGISAVVLYLHEYYRTHNPIGLKGLFSLFWIGGQAVSCLKLSQLQTRWSLITWLCFFLAYICFCIGYHLVEGQYYSREESRSRTRQRIRINEKRLYLCIVGMTVISMLCFLFEAVMLGYIPFFSDEPHAYSYFHITGVHYFTVMCVLVPALSVVYLKISKIVRAKQLVGIIICIGLSMLIPILCVSRFQLVAMILLALLTYLSMKPELKLGHIIVLAGIFLALIMPVYFRLTVARNHDVEYLNGVFEMKNTSEIGRAHV